VHEYKKIVLVNELRCHLNDACQNPVLKSASVMQLILFAFRNNVYILCVGDSSCDNERFNLREYRRNVSLELFRAAFVC
jgi:hypothetical protein